MKQKLYCYSHTEFDKMCEENGWSDNNIPEDAIFISITGTPECQNYYIEEEEFHWFKKEIPGKILNLEFDDIPDSETTWKGHKFIGITPGQAEEIINLIEENPGKDIHVHCRAGKSRSQGVVRFILDMYPNREYKTRPDNPCVSPNMYVVRTLKRAYYQKHGLFITEQSEF